MATTLSHDVRSGSLVGAVNAARGLLERFPTSLLALAFRLAVATVFWRSGLTKTASWDATIALFDMEYMLPILPPALGAYLATTVELSCSALLALGAANRCVLEQAMTNRSLNSRIEWRRSSIPSGRP